MVEAVQAFKAQDGTVFNSLEEAETYEKSLNLKANIEELFSEKYNKEKIPVKVRQNVINFIVENSEDFKNLF